LQHPKNIEILCGENCIPDCPMRVLHYADISAHQLMLSNRPQQFDCPYRKERPMNFYEAIQT